MPLTPDDIRNLAFKKPPIGKRGYDDEEVDGFLDEFERELARLIEENNQLRAQSERGVGGEGASELTELQSQFERVQREKDAAEQAARSMQAELDQLRTQDAGVVTAGDGEQRALQVLVMAQRTADDHVNEARREADKVLFDAQAKAEEITHDARADADALELDARQRHQTAITELDAKRAALQKHVEELKHFESEHRARLKAYLESQLRELDGRAQGQ